MGNMIDNINIFDRYSSDSSYQFQLTLQPRTQIGAVGTSSSGDTDSGSGEDLHIIEGNISNVTATSRSRPWLSVASTSQQSLGVAGTTSSTTTTTTTTSTTRQSQPELTPSSSGLSVDVASTNVSESDRRNVEKLIQKIRVSGAVDEDQDEDATQDSYPATILLDSPPSPTKDLHESQSDGEAGTSFIPTTVDVDRPAYKESTSDVVCNSWWQYKKSPKGPPLRQTWEPNIVPPQDSHKKGVFIDPVFHKSQKNSDNSRICDANDVTPNPEKLSNLGREIEYINEKMALLSNSSQDRKEKMKLSSRMCRMRRSANHEANKIKFAGLEKEREELSGVIRQLRSALATADGSLLPGRLAEEMYFTKVAGRTREYVDNVLQMRDLAIYTAANNSSKGTMH